MPYKGALVVLTSFYNELPMMKGRPSNENRSSVGYLDRAASTIMNFRDINALSMAIASRKKNKKSLIYKIIAIKPNCYSFLL